MYAQIDKPTLERRWFRFRLRTLLGLGYPELAPFDEGYWECFWRIYSHLVKNRLHVGVGNGSKS